MKIQAITANHAGRSSRRVQAVRTWERLKHIFECYLGDPRGGGGTPYLQWLQQLIDEYRSAPGWK